MDGPGFPQNAPNAERPEKKKAPQAVGRRELAMKFESLGGSGHGSEFAIFQQHLGAEPDGLLAWMDLGADLLIAALESRFDGVGLAENTIVFAPGRGDEWWTKDTRFWMARRSFVKTDAFSVDQARLEICHRLQSLRDKLIADLRAGEKIFVFRNMHRDLSEAEIGQIHAAVRAYGDTTLLYVRRFDSDHPAGTVEVTAPGLLIGFIDHFAYSPDNQPVGPAEEDWYALCERAFLMCKPPPIHCPDSTSAPVMEQPQAPSIPEGSSHVPRVAQRVKGQRGRQIVLIGNCQMQAMAGLYKRFVAGRTGDIVEHVPSYQDLTAEHRNAIQQADVVVEQLFDLKPQVDTDTLSTTTPRLFIPMVTAAFLWPFAGSPHPKNAFYPYLTGGPYGGEASDSYLNRLIMAGTDPEEAVETYANLEVNSRVNLDRLFEIVMDRQRSRDEAAGYQIADIMERHFRAEQIFLSPYHPNVRIATALARQFFNRLGAQQDEIDRMIDCTRITPFPKSELPFHPSVCRHFGLDWVAPDRRYRFQNEGLFTFREYALRYMRYEWNDALEEGMHLSHIGKLDEARERLTVGIERSPQSAAGYNALSHVLNHRGAPDEAITALQRAVEIEPDSAPYRANLGNLLRQNRRLDEALTELRSAVAMDPVHPHYYVLLAHLLRQRGTGAEALDLIREAIRLDPYAAGLRAELAGFLESNGDLAGAVESLQDAVALAPADEGVHHRLAHLLGRVNRLDDAIEAARAAIELAPASTRARVVMSELLLRKGDPADALNEAYVAAVTEPDSAHAYGHLGHVLHLTGDLLAAEAAFRRAAKLDSRNAHFRHEISVVLNLQQRHPEAIAAAREATELESGNPYRFVHLAALLAQSGDLAGAQVAQRSAVNLQPESVPFRVTLSDLFARDKQLDEALAEASIAVECHPNSGHALGHLAHVMELRGDFDPAEETLRFALTVEPLNEYLLRRMASLRNRVSRIRAL
jgi:tetratricopeptide (TPR) repeat protein